MLLLLLAVVVGGLLGLARSAPGAISIPWTGTWETTYGTLQLTQSGSHVTGNYTYRNGTFDGTVTGATIQGTWDERASGGPTEFGPFEWTMSPEGLTFTGTWSRSGTGEGGSWNGTRTSPLAPNGTFRRKKCKPVGGIFIAAQGIGCTKARRIARALLNGQVPGGYQCVRNRPNSWVNNPKKQNRILWICGKVPSDNPNNEAQVISVIPPGLANCQDLVYQGRTYAILAKKVTCQYARGNTLRAFRGEDPIVAEFIPSGETPKWRCVSWVFVSGACTKPSEGRALAWELQR